MEAVGEGSSLLDCGSVLRPCPQDTSSQTLPGFCVPSSRQLIHRWAGEMGGAGLGAGLRAGRWEMSGDRTPEPGSQKSKVIVSVSMRAHPPMWRPCPVP